MCLVHHEAISLLSNSEQRAVFQLGAISRYPLEWLQASGSGSVHVPQKMPGLALGAAERLREAFLTALHLGRAAVTVQEQPAHHWCVGRRRGSCQPKYRCTELLLQPTYVRHPRTEGNTPWATIRPPRLILLPCRGTPL